MFDPYFAWDLQDVTLGKGVMHKSRVERMTHYHPRTLKEKIWLMEYGHIQH